MKQLFQLGFPLILGLLLNLPAQALTFGTYEIHDHPDGSARPPLYGLRLDRLDGTNSIFTFEFDYDSQTGMTMSYTSGMIELEGTVYGGKNSGSGYTGATYWDVYFKYDTGVTDSGLPTDGATHEVGVEANHANFGTITDGSSTWDLRDHAKSGGDLDGWSFLLTQDHRGFNGLSGWGWLDHNLIETGQQQDSGWGGSEDGCCGDWLFTVGNRVPEPASLALLAMGLFGLGSAARFR